MSNRGERVGLRVARSLHEGLLRVAREGQASLFMVLQAGIAALLTRLGGGNTYRSGHR